MALTTNTQSNSESIVNHATGQVVTDAGGAVDTTFSIGFTPRIVRWVNQTSRITLEWAEGMAALSAIRTIAAGTRTLDVASGITVLTNLTNPGAGNAFMIKAADIPVSSVFYWEAIA